MKYNKPGASTGNLPSFGTANDHLTKLLEHANPFDVKKGPEV